MNKSFNIEDMESMVNAINITRKVVETNTEDLVTPIRDYCMGIRKWMDDEKSKILAFINKHSNLFYEYNKNKKYYFNKIESRKCRNWDIDRTSVYIDNIEITVNPETGIATDIELELEFQYNNKIGIHRRNRHNNYVDFNNAKYDIDFWNDTKKGFDELKEDFGFLIDEFTKCIKAIQNKEVSRVKNIIETCREVEKQEKDNEERIVIIIKK